MGCQKIIETESFYIKTLVRKKQCYFPCLCLDLGPNATLYYDVIYKGSDAQAPRVGLMRCRLVSPSVTIVTVNTDQKSVDGNDTSPKDPSGTYGLDRFLQ